MEILRIAGGGSIIRGILTAPIFVFGIIQIFRGFRSIFDADLKKMCTKNDSIWNYLYIPATALGYIAVFMVIYFCGAAA